MAAGFSRSMAASAKRMEPRHGRSTPEIVAVERGLAGAVRAQHGDDLAGADREIDAAQDFGRAVAGVQAADREQGLSHARLPRPRAAGRAMAEIGLDHPRIARDRLRRAFGDDAPFGQHDRPARRGSSPPA